MIVRVLGEGQFEVDEEVAKGLNDLDEQAERALEAGDQKHFSELLERMAEAVRTNGSRVPDEDLSPSEAIIPPEDLTLDEARELFEGDGLIPDLPTHKGSARASPPGWGEEDPPAARAERNPQKRACLCRDGA